MAATPRLWSGPGHSPRIGMLSSVPMTGISGGKRCASQSYAARASARRPASLGVPVEPE